MEKRNMKKYIILSISLCLNLLSQEVIPNSKKVTLAWDSNIEPELVGYTVKIGRKSKELSSVYDVGKITEWVTPDLSLGYWYTSVYAYDKDKAESPPSEELTLNIRRCLSQVSIDKVNWETFSDKVFCFSSKYEPRTASPPIISVGRNQKFFRYSFTDEIATISALPSISPSGIFIQWNPPSPIEEVIDFKIYELVSDKWVIQSTVYPPNISYLIQKTGTYSVTASNVKKGESIKSNSMNIFISNPPLAPKSLRVKNQ